ncbi:MAG: undecaprenyl-diphosphate phosphatase [Deltaproteobacteria bacterium]|nr:undecaprenyl-diphosphate phosphatase [Deltaproteobacteria bacterium]
MNTGEAIILGVVQGLTEFLPVSSSAHLVFTQSLIPEFHQPGVLFDVTLHLGTLFAVIFFLRKNIADIMVSLTEIQWRRGCSGNTLKSGGVRTAFLIILATFCTGAIGLPFKSRVEELFQSVETAACMLLITGVLLYLAGKAKKGIKKEENMTVADGIIIGIAQGVAIMPGISRSGATIAFGIFRNVDPAAAARFSFLLSIPAIVGAVLLQARHISSVSPHDLPVYVAGFTAALIAGFASLKLLFKVIHNAGLQFFAYYCWFIGIAALIAKSV